MPRNSNATPTDVNQIKPVHYLVKQETILPSQRDDCHPLLADFGIDQFSIRNNEKRENLKNKPSNPFVFQTGEACRSHNKRPIKE